MPSPNSIRPLTPNCNKDLRAAVADVGGNVLNHRQRGRFRAAVMLLHPFPLGRAAPVSEGSLTPLSRTQHRGSLRLANSFHKARQDYQSLNKQEHLRKLSILQETRPINYHKSYIDQYRKS